MKGIIILCLLAFCFSAFAQAPQAFNFQGVARTSDNQPVVNKTISIKNSILISSVSGTAVYSETHSVTTDGLGLFTIKVGQGNSTLGQFDQILWGADNHFLKIEADFSGGSNYSLIGTSQLMSVPYSLFAEKTRFNYYISPIDTIKVTPGFPGYGPNLLNWIDGEPEVMTVSYSNVPSGLTFKSLPVGSIEDTKFPLEFSYSNQLAQGNHKVTVSATSASGITKTRDFIISYFCWAYSTPTSLSGTYDVTEICNNSGLGSSVVNYVRTLNSIGPYMYSINDFADYSGVTMQLSLNDCKQISLTDYDSNNISITSGSGTVSYQSSTEKKFTLNYTVTDKTNLSTSTCTATYLKQ